MKTKFAMISALAFGLATSAQALTVQEAGGWFESVYAKWTAVSDAASYNVYVDGTKIDDALIRTYSGYIRADVPGLKAGSHTIKIAAVIGSSESSTETASKSVTAKAFDRTGFAFSNGHIPGAYNVDGTLKSGAVIVYVSENTKNTVSMDVKTSSKGTTTTCTGVQGILNCYKKGYEDRPLDIRLIGNVTDPEVLEAGDMMIDLGTSENAYVTVEGIGEDATVNGWGIRIKNAMNVEVRNVGIMNVNSNEGDNIGLQQNDAYVWIHNNDFFYGHAGSDADQVKGDGALDCKKSSYITFSYNHFWDNGKSNLLGLSEGVFSYNTTDYYITYHHNWYDHSDSRHPRVRYYNAHVYNNYYDGNAKYGAGSTLGSSVFMEGNYFRNCKYPMLTSMQGSDIYAGTNKSSTDNATFSKEAGGTIKAFNNYMDGAFTFIPYGASSYTNKGTDVTASSMGVDTKTDFDAYVVSTASETVPNTVKSKVGSHYYSNFDTKSAMYSYKADEPEAAKENVTTYAGRMNGGDFQWEFTAADDELYAVNQPLKDKLMAYTGSVKSIQGTGTVIVTSSSSTATSSSSEGKSSSSSVKSSSSAASSSSVSSSSGKSSSSSYNEDYDEDDSTAPIISSITHNFTEDALGSDYFSFVGNLSTAKGSITVNGEELSRCLKIESATEINFVLGKAATVTLYFNTDFVKKIKVNGESTTATAGVVTLNLSEGSYKITKGDVANLYLIDVKIEGSVSSASNDNSSSSVVSSSSEANSSDSNVSSSSVAGSSDSNVSSSSSSDDKTAIQTIRTNAAANITFNRSANHLTVNSSGVQSVDIVSVTGQVVLHSVNGQKEFDLAKMPRGMYVIRAVTAEGVMQMKIAK